MDREENERFSFGGSATQMTTRSNNPLIKVALFLPHYVGERVIGMGHMLGQVARHRRQGKPRMRWLDSIKEATSLHLEVLKEIVKDRKKKGACWWKKRLGIGNAQM